MIAAFLKWMSLLKTVGGPTVDLALVFCRMPPEGRIKGAKRILIRVRKVFPLSSNVGQHELNIYIKGKRGHPLQVSMGTAK